MYQIKIRSFFTFGLTEELSLKYDADNNLIVEVEPGTSVVGLLQKLPLFGPKVRLDDLIIFVYINGRPGTTDYMLQPGDVVDLHVPAMGG